ncbi:hypothetical protein [Aureivirga marina]|uniref:hypothetical protein n=1 Tax=Aureivirga marina TaxID=1182451 RepID=UPI0018C94E16|nr:hypothetical protein [Aureivirga marina]
MIKKYYLGAILVISLCFSCSKADLDVIYGENPEENLITNPDENIDNTDSGDNSSNTDDNSDNTDNTDDTNNSDKSLVGIWKGVMNCKPCGNGNASYTYTLDIFTDENNEITGTIHLIDIDFNTETGLYSISGEYNSDLELVIDQTILIEENGDNGDYCEGNVYQFQISENKTEMDGHWISSESCSQFWLFNSTEDTFDIHIEKEN